MRPGNVHLRPFCGGAGACACCSLPSPGAPSGGRAASYWRCSGCWETVTAAFGLTVNSVHLALGRDTPLKPGASSGFPCRWPRVLPAARVQRCYVPRVPHRDSFARARLAHQHRHAFLIVALSLADSSFAVPPYVLLYSLTWYGFLASSISLALQVSATPSCSGRWFGSMQAGYPHVGLLMTAVLGGVFLRGIASRVSLLATVGFYDFGRFDYHDSQLEGMVGLVRLGLFAVAPLALAWLVRVRQPRRERPEEN